MVYHTEQVCGDSGRILGDCTCGIKRRAGSPGDLPDVFYLRGAEYEKLKDGGIRPLKFVPKNMPYFLEGPVRYLKPACGAGRSVPCTKRSKSDLYDGELSMYKVNASLADSSLLNLGVRAFTPGWLENESIWLHMEYKYLPLNFCAAVSMKNFLADSKKAAIPFQNPETYGRSIFYENSSFEASSRNPNPSLPRERIVAQDPADQRSNLSACGKRWMFGAHPFRTEQGGTGLFA